MVGPPVGLIIGVALVFLITKLNLTKWQRIGYICFLIFLFIGYRALPCSALITYLVMLAFVYALRFGLRKQGGTSRALVALRSMPAPLIALALYWIIIFSVPYQYGVVWQPNGDRDQIRQNPITGQTFQYVALDQQWVDAAPPCGHLNTPPDFPARDPGTIRPWTIRVHDCGDYNVEWGASPEPRYLPHPALPTVQLASRPVATGAPLPTSPRQQAQNAAVAQPVNLLAAQFVITGGSLVDQSAWRKITIGVDADGDLYVVTNGNATKWNPETEKWAFGDPVAWTSATELVSEQPAVVRAMCKKHVPVSVFDEILADETGRIAHAAIEPACPLVAGLGAPTEALPTGASVPAPSGRLLEETQFADYTIRIALKNTDADADSVLEILKGRARVYADENNSVAIAGYNEGGTAIGAPVGADVTGLGVPDLVVREYSGGAHCCTSFEVFSFGPNFQKLATIQSGDCDRSHFQRQSDGGYVFNGCDAAVKMYGTGEADAAIPEVAMRYANGSFHLAPDLMRKPPPTIEELKAKATEIAGSPTWSTKDVPGLFWRYVIDLTYSGNWRSADQFIALAWPAQRADKSEQVEEFMAQMQKSPYWADIQALNPH